jgi:hypothetical protein
MRLTKEDDDEEASISEASVSRVLGINRSFEERALTQQEVDPNEFPEPPSSKPLGCSPERDSWSGFLQLYEYSRDGTTSTHLPLGQVGDKIGDDGEEGFAPSEPVSLKNPRCLTSPCPAQEEPTPEARLSRVCGRVVPGG